RHRGQGARSPDRNLHPVVTLKARSRKNRSILPALNRCAICGKPKEECRKPRGRGENDWLDHEFERDKMLPEWHGWTAARRGLGTKLYRLGAPEKTIQAILRHANVSTTNTYYIKSAADDTRVAMAKLEKLVIGNTEATILQSGNEVATPEAATPIALI